MSATTAQRLLTLLQRSVLLVVLGFLSACTSVPFDYPRVPSQAIPASTDTYYGTQLANWTAREGADMTGSVLLVRGMDALGSRLVMMDRAEATIDAQYFLLKPDKAGDLFLGKLLRAAERGVRVRLLLDDIFTPRNDRMLAIFNSHPNIEVRLFNPVSRASPKAWSFLWDFSRVNRRMHNKSFIVDGSLAIMGGRNIAEEYFELQPEQDFNDFEVLVFGEVVPEIARSFDRYWNSSQTVPMEAFRVADKPERVQRWLDYMNEVVSGERPSPYAAAINSPFLQRILDGEVAPHVSPADMVYDSPRKLRAARNEDDHRRLEAALRQRLEGAEEELVLITPYLVPRDLSYQLLNTLRERGVRVVIITNSLASTNHVVVHSAYAPKRKGMLEAGVELYELKVDNAPLYSRRSSEAERVTLHTKAIIIDGQSLFTGSLNLDPRSIELNTEAGLFIDSPEAAGEYRDIVFRDLDEDTYQVVLDEKGRLRWLDAETGARWSTEPDTGLWRRFKAGFFGILPIESQL